MRIGVFGDSFADENMREGKSWISWLRENDDVTSVTSFGKGGSSLEFSYQNFLNNHNSYDRCIFLATEPNRMHMWDRRRNIESMFQIDFKTSMNLLKGRLRDKHEKKDEWKIRLDQEDNIILKGLDAMNKKYMNTHDWKTNAITDAVKYRRPDTIIAQFESLCDLQRLDMKNLQSMPKYETNDRPCHMSLKQNEEFANYILQENFLNTLEEVEKYYTLSKNKKEAGLLE